MIKKEKNNTSCYILYSLAILSLCSVIGRKEILIPMIILLLSITIFHTKNKIYANERLDKTATLIIIFTIIWLLITSLWSPLPITESIFRIVKLIGSIIIGCLFFSTLQKISFLKMKRLAIGMAIGISIASITLFTIYGAARIGYSLIEVMPNTIHKLNKSIVFITIISPSTLLILFKNNHTKLLLITSITAAIAILISYILAAKIALLIGMIVFILTYFLPRFSTVFVEISVFFFVLLSPAIITIIPPPVVSIDWEWLPESSRHRLVIWDISVEKIKERPILGWGFNSSREIFQNSEKLGSPSTESIITTLGIPIHSHNVSIQLWMEVGGVGIALTSLFLMRLFWIINRKKMPPLTYACTISTISSIFIISMVSYGFWEHWWQILLWIPTTFLCWTINNPQEKNNRIHY